MSETTPDVAVLLATLNGAAHLDEQLDTILRQEGAVVRVLVSDDGSTDGTAELLRERAAADGRIEILPDAPASGGSAANFYRLLRDADLRDADAVAFSDQDDRWLPGKLARHWRIVQQGVAVVSSNVTAFDERGRRTLLRKDWPQRRYDFLAQGPGPGCTFLMSPAFVALFRQTLAEVPEAALARFHDSLGYVIGRAAGLPWTIDAEPSVDYRQHEGNVLGANVGGAAARERLRLIRSRWHRDEAALHARVAIHVAERAGRSEAAAEYRRLLALFEDPGLAARLRLLRYAGQLRRRPRDRCILWALILVGVW